MEKSYLDARIENIKDSITVVDLMNFFGVRVEYSDRACQVRCPFPGHKRDDAVKSARIYPDTNMFYCFVCTTGQPWDVIEFTMKYENLSFLEALSFLEREFKIDLIDEKLFPEEISQEVEEALRQSFQKREIRVEDRIRALEKQIIRSRDALTLKQYYKLFLALDKLAFDFRQENKSQSEVIGLLKKLERKLKNLLEKPKSASNFVLLM